MGKNPDPFMLIRLQNSFASMTQMVREQERTSNNLANAGTLGYKRDRTFTEALNERLDAEAAPRSDRFARQWADLEQGAVEKTGNPLDLALNGGGFFVVRDEATGAERYTRAGRFLLDEGGTLRTPAGLAVEGESGPIQVPPTSGPVEISETGEVRAGRETVGRLRVVDFENPMQLQRLDGSMFVANGARPADAEGVAVMQGYVETSNVDPIGEMTDMITQFRLFESQQKALHTTDQVLGAITRDLAKF